MRTEKIVISFIAVLVGILASALAFYFYQSTKVVPPSNIKIVSVTSPKPEKVTTQKSSFFLTVDTPKDEDVVENRVVTIAGKTTSDATILISTISADEIITPAKNGDFSTTVTLDSGENYIEINAISPSGEETKVTKTISVSTESF